MSKSVKKSKSFISLLIVTVMMLSMSIPAVYAQTADVSDIGNHWAKNEISVWVSQGFIKGYSDGTFKPDSSITRAEFIALVNRVFAFSEKAPVPFADVKESDWFYADFAKAGKAGYLTGYEDGKVAPNGFITRQEVAAIAAKVKSLPEDLAGASGFADAAMISAGRKGSVGAVVNAKIMNGYPSGKFEPANGITRAESVITLNRLMNLKATEQTVQIEAIADKAISKAFSYNVPIKLLTADAKLSVQSSDASIAQATLTDSNIKLLGLKAGVATITVTGKKAGMKDGVVTFKVTVSAATSGGGGGGGGSNNGGGSGPSASESRLTAVKAVVGATTLVSGKYDSYVKTIEIIYGTTKLTPVMSNGNFSCSIDLGLEIGDKVTINGYAGSKLLDTDEVIVVEDDSVLTNVQARGTAATQVTGSYAAGVTKILVLCNGKSYEAAMEAGSFFRNLTGVQGKTITVEAYIGDVLVDSDVATEGTAPVPNENMLTNVQARGTAATQVTGNYAAGVTKILVLCNGKSYEAAMEAGSFFRNLTGVQGKTITVEAYIGDVLVDSDVATEGTAPVPDENMLTNVQARGTAATQVTGNYAAGVTKILVLCNGKSYEAAMEAGSFFRNLTGVQGKTITVEAYIGDVLVDSDVAAEGTAPVPDENMLTNVQARGTAATQVTGSYAAGVTKILVLCNGKSYEAAMEAGSFFRNLTGVQGKEITVEAYVGNVLVDSDVAVEGTDPGTDPKISDITAITMAGMFIHVEGSYETGVTEIWVHFGNQKGKATLDDGTFTYDVVLGSTAITQVTVKAYVGEVETDSIPVNVQ